jgi:hypothetical protein
VLHPDSFCWSKFGIEAGEAVESILARKERERRQNGGVFLWGIGTSIWPSLRALLAIKSSPSIVFSPMLSRPANIDVLPDFIALWTAACGMDGSAFEIPQYSMVSSRFMPHRQRRHFALVCSSDNEIRDTSIDGRYLYRSELRNYVNGTVLGASQVTAVVRRVPGTPRTEKPYRVAFTAKLTYPYLIELLRPKTFPRSDAQLASPLVGAR